MALVGYGGIMTDPDHLRTRFSSQVRSRSFNRAQGYANPRFEELAAKQLVTLDADERERMVKDMQRIVAEDVPVLPLSVPRRVAFFTEGEFDAWYATPGCSPCPAHLPGQR